MLAQMGDLDGAMKEVSCRHPIYPCPSSKSRIEVCFGYRCTHSPLVPLQMWPCSLPLRYHASTLCVQMERIRRRAPGSADMRAALAALYYDKGLRERAEDLWLFTCDNISVREADAQDAMHAHAYSSHSPHSMDMRFPVAR